VAQTIKAPFFLYPDEQSIQGSTVAFHALLMEMVELKRYAVAKLIFRKNSAPRFVALVAQEEKIDSEGVQTQPPGLQVIFLPYADDIRSLQFPPAEVADSDLILQAKKIVKNLSIQYEPSFFENPSLQYHYKSLQALALEEMISSDSFEDLAQPDVEGMNKFEDDLKTFQLAAFGEPAPELKDSGDMDVEGGDGEDGDGDGGGGGGGDSKSPDRKRKAPSGGASRGGSKKAKHEEKDSAGGAENIDWADAVQTGSIKKYNISQLKDYLREHRQPLSGKKEDLIKRIQKHLKM